MRSVRPTMTLPELVALQEGEAAALEGTVHDLQQSARTGALLAKRLTEQLLSDVRANVADRDRFVRERFPSLADVGEGDVNSVKLQQALLERELACIELFSDRLCDFVEGTNTQVARIISRAATLRETAATLRQVDGAFASGAAEHTPEADGAREGASPAPEQAEPVHPDDFGGSDYPHAGH